tara:strand:- start:191598 stop:192248 length:651 start_codon:yes stop_codon:yes gene_type:complete
MFRVHQVFVIGLLFGSCSLIADDGLLTDDDVSTATGDILDAQGDRAVALGKGALLKSLSAEQFQDAIDKRLENRKERIEQYYELRQIRENELREEAADVSAETQQRIASRRAPDRLDEQQFNARTGEIFWPAPLDHERLKPYRKPIEETLAKRKSPGAVYRQWDYFRVARMVRLMGEAVDSIEDKLDTREYLALKDYLEQIDYEARFDANDNRVDF